MVVEYTCKTTAHNGECVGVSIECMRTAVATKTTNEIKQKKTCTKQ